jgi:hypothetical protein
MSRLNLIARIEDKVLILEKVNPPEPDRSKLNRKDE